MPNDIAIDLLEDRLLANSVGRPTKLDLNDSLLKHVKELAKKGLTDEEIAEQLGIDVGTFYRYKNRSEQFCKAVKEGKSPVDDMVEHSLLERALGYSTFETKVFCNSDGQVTTHEVEKKYAPDVTAMIFWLKNRRRAEWREKIEHEIGGSENPIQLAYDATKRLTQPKEEDNKDE